ncbi:MAG: hypothetical protein CVU62_10390 [Deltaproteobacteria bacterium HGW-Deltaproteobacteria-2]|jgi:rare lipoprotein A (peptidoglycan hydrolase)|nr:MAG: hypothetical protein CVU62_10390 [Deltaproteobacteria bacterium HGW-Deltaproteobacteria-2]
MRDIKIFVSHRIEFDSRTVDNPLFFPMRCGAVDDKRAGYKMPGDDTGENISDHRVSFGEFTVQYWAWKNINADYYGICHYRRYLSFSPRRYYNIENAELIDPLLNSQAIKRYRLMDSKRMRDLIEANDAIVNNAQDIRFWRSAETVYDLWVSWHNMEKASIDLLLPLIKELRPEYLQSAQEYFSDAYHRGHNCFIFRRELFFQYCEFVFDILFALEKKLDNSGYKETFPRTPGFLAEIMYGIFVHHLHRQEKYRIKELPLVFFEETRKTHNNLSQAVKRYIRLTQNYLRLRSYDILPLESKRRATLRWLYHSIKDPLSALFIVSLVTLFISAGCQTIPQAQKAEEPTPAQVIIKYSEPDGAVGIARYYKKRYNGRKTTSGEIYSSKKLTAAHPTLPMGTLVEVENLSNNKSVIVKINDRCREHEEVFIDLSRQAARQLGMIKQGRANVRITIINETNQSDEETSDTQD